MIDLQALDTAFLLAASIACPGNACECAAPERMRGERGCLLNLSQQRSIGLRRSISHWVGCFGNRNDTLAAEVVRSLPLKGTFAIDVVVDDDEREGRKRRRKRGDTSAARSRVGAAGEMVSGTRREARQRKHSNLPSCPV